jgi:hypothetical protein
MFSAICELQSYVSQWEILIPNYLGRFNTNYIIFTNVEIFKKEILQMTKNCEEKYWIFKNILFVKMKIQNYLINWQRCVKAA